MGFWGSTGRWGTRSSPPCRLHRSVDIDHLWHLTRRFRLVGDDATDEVGSRRTERRHQVIQLFLLGCYFHKETTFEYTNKMTISDRRNGFVNVGPERRLESEI